MAGGIQFGQLHWSDILVIALYYAGSLGIGVYSICKTKNNLNSVFLAGRSLTWWPIGMSLFASNIGSINFVGIAGAGAASGLAVIQFEWGAVYLLILLGWLFLPVYFTSGIYTIPEYLHKRFGGQRLRVYLSVIALLTYVFAILSVDLYSGALFIQHTLGWNIYIGVAIILGTTFLFTVLGGLMTVVLTDAFAVIVMVVGGFLLFILGMIKVGGFGELQRKYSESVPNITMPNSTCNFPRDDAWHIFRDSLEADYPGLATFLRTIFGGMWFWCSNQLIVQRSLAAKNIVHAKAGSILASYLKLTPIFIMVFPGMISRALFPDEVACATPETCLEICGNAAGCTNIAYPKLAVELLPNGLRGLLVAAMLAAVISSLTSIFNSSSSIVTIDIWKRLRTNAKEREQMIVAKVFLVFLVAASVAWIPIMHNAEGGQIYKYATAANGLFGGPTCGLFLVAVLCGRVNETGAFWGLIIGQLWGITRFILDIVYKSPPCGQEDARPAFLRYWHVYYHTASQVILTVIVSVVVSLFTKPPSPDQLAGTTFWTKFVKSQSGSSCDSHNIPLKDFGSSSNTSSTMVTSSDKQVDCEKSLLHEDQTERNPDFTDGRSDAKECLKIRVKKVFIKAYHTSFKGNEKFLECMDKSGRFVYLKETTFWRICLNINAFVVVALVTAFFIYLG